MSHLPHNMIGLNGSQPSPKLSPSSHSPHRINRIYIKRYMKRFITILIQILNSLPHNLTNSQLSHMIHRKTLYIVFLYIDPLVRIYITNSNKYHMFKWKYILQPRKSRYFKSTSMTQWMTMISWIFVWRLRVNHIWMSIDPYHSQIFVQSFKSMNCSTTN